MRLKLLLYFVPLLPFLVRGFLLMFIRRWRKLLSEVLPEEENERDANRTVILALAGFSFSALLAIAVVDVTSGLDMHLTIYYLLVSFLSYFSALNLQGYKFNRWHDLLSDSLIEAASLSLLFSVAVIIYSSIHYSLSFKISCFVLAGLVWVIDHVIRLQVILKYLRIKGESQWSAATMIKEAGQVERGREAASAAVSATSAAEPTHSATPRAAPARTARRKGKRRSKNL